MNKAEGVVLDTGPIGEVPAAGSRLSKLAIGAGVFLTAYAADELATRLRWNISEPQIIPYEADAHQTYADERWLLAPGHGQHDPRPLADVLMNGAFRGHDLSYFQYSLQDFDVRKMGDRLYDVSQTAGRLSLVGNSLGTITTLKAYLMLPEEQQRQVPPLKRMVLNGCPLDLDDTYDAKLARIISHVPYSGGVTTKFLVGTIDRLRKRREEGRTIYRSIRDGFRAVWDNQSPKTWKLQTDFLVEVSRPNLMEHTDKLRNFITPETRALYCMPDEAGADTTVIDRQAYGKWALFFEGLGVQLDQLLMPNARHADIPRLSQTVGSWLEKTAPGRTAS